MTGSDQIEFQPEPARPSSGGRSLPIRIGIVVGSAMLFVVGAVAAMGASPAPSTTTAPAATADPSASAAPGAIKGDDHWGGPMGGGPMGGIRDITIASISGSSVSLKTGDGWTRTITVTADTAITKGGKTIALTDLAGGDEIRFKQTRNDDGTYTITAIHVVLPTIAGEVTAIDGSTITVTQHGGAIATIHVSGDTTYTVKGSTTATLSDIKVGSLIVAEGTQRTDGSLDAAVVRSGPGGPGDRSGPGGPGDRHGRGFPGDQDGDHAAPDATPAPSTNAG